MENENGTPFSWLVPIRIMVCSIPNVYFVTWCVHGTWELIKYELVVIRLEKKVEKEIATDLHEKHYSGNAWH